MQCIVFLLMCIVFYLHVYCIFFLCVFYFICMCNAYVFYCILFPFFHFLCQSSNLRNCSDYNPNLLFLGSVYFCVATTEGVPRTKAPSLFQDGSEQEISARGFQPAH